MQAHILITGFEPFGGETVNPSWQVAQALHGSRIEAPAGAAEVAAVQLPCVFGAALQALEAALARHPATLVLALGQAGGRNELSLERVAINLNDARIADNAGARPIDTPVVADAPAAYFSTLPIKAMAAAARATGVPAGISHTAGTFVCNHVFYGLMHALRRRRGVRAGFMHLPLLPEQAALQAGGTVQPSMALAQQVQGVRAALAAALATHEDLHSSAGTEA